MPNTDPDALRAWQKQYREKNRERIAAYQKQWKIENRQRIRDWSRNWEAENRDEINARKVESRKKPEIKAQRKQYGAMYYLHKAELQRKRCVVNSARQHARAKGLEFDLTVENLHWPTHCPVLGTELNYGPPGNGRNSYDSPSIDRHDPSQGYVHTNCRVMSWRANRIKTDASIDELRELLSYLILTRSH